MTPFGYELEFCGANLPRLSKGMQIPLYPKRKCKNYDTFHLETEEKITTENLNGGELISPIYKEKALALQELKEVLKVLKIHQAYIPEKSRNTAIHVHLEKSFLKEEKVYYEALLKFLYAFQSEIFEYAAYQEGIRPNVYDNCSPLKEADIIGFLNDFPKNIEFASKRKCIRFTKETFELRYFSSSLDFERARLPLEFAFSLADYIKKEKWNMKEINTWYRNTYIYPRGYNPERAEILKNTLHL